MNSIKKYNVGIVDIDDTLVSGFWKEDGETPNQSVIDFVKNNIESIIIVTGRQDTMREVTAKLLDSLGIKYDALLMNPEHYDKSDEFKDGIASNLQGKIDIAIDDNPDVRAIYESYGIKSIDPAVIWVGIKALYNRGIMLSRESKIDAIIDIIHDQLKGKHKDKLARELAEEILEEISDELPAWYDHG